jgi:hypothetical protein
MQGGTDVSLEAIDITMGTLTGAVAGVGVCCIEQPSCCVVPSCCIQVRPDDLTIEQSVSPMFLAAITKAAAIPAAR